MTFEAHPLYLSRPGRLGATGDGNSTTLPPQFVIFRESIDSGESRDFLPLSVCCLLWKLIVLLHFEMLSSQAPHNRRRLCRALGELVQEGSRCARQGYLW